MTTTGSEKTLLQVSQARCRIGRSGVLTVADFALHSGQFCCLFGPNGAGKTLLSNLIAGRRVESGSYVQYAAGFDPRRDIHLVSFEEQQRLWQRENRLDMSEYSARAEDSGTLVGDYIRSSRHGEAQDETLLALLLRELDLESFCGRGVRFLSSGQVRRVLIARALYAWHDASEQLLILDEPLESIDRDSRQRIAHCIEQHVPAGTAILQLCRRRADIPSAATHLALMDGLELLEQGEPEALRQGELFSALTGRRPQLPAKLPRAQSADIPQAQLPYLELEGVVASYGDKTVLEDINWRMTAQEHVLIEGPNGCGKSTLLSLIDGENHKAYGQRVRLFGKQRGSGETVWDIKARFGLVSNELHNKYVKGWRVIDVVVSGFYASVGLYDESGAQQVNQARAWLHALCIESFERHYYHELSFGQQRLVLLARAMVKQPAILVLDEPCVGLDDYHREQILGTLDLIAVQSSTCIIYVSHVEDEAPACINQLLRFVATASGAYTIEQIPI